MIETAPATINKAIEAWERDGAQEILGEVLGSVANANSIIEPIHPVDGLKIAVVRFPWEKKVPVIGQHTGWRSIGLALDEGQIPLFITPLIAPIATHEVVHVARHQHISGGVPKNPSTDLFEGVFTEGIALLAQEHLFPEDNVDGFPLNYVPSEYEPVEVEAEALLRNYSNTDRPDSREVLDYIIGDYSFPQKGYKVGYYMAKTLMSKGFSIEDLIAMPTNEVFQQMVKA